MIRPNCPSNVQKGFAKTAGHCHDAETRKPLSDLSYCLDAFLIWHNEVCHQEVHMLSANVIYCLLSVGSLHYVVPGRSKHIAQKFSYCWVIICNDNACLPWHVKHFSDAMQKGVASERLLQIRPLRVK